MQEWGGTERLKKIRNGFVCRIMLGQGTCFENIQFVSDTLKKCGSFIVLHHPLDARSKLKFLCTFNLRPVFRGNYDTLQHRFKNFNTWAYRKTFFYWNIRLYCWLLGNSDIIISQGAYPWLSYILKSFNTGYKYTNVYYNKDASIIYLVEWAPYPGVVQFYLLLNEAVKYSSLLRSF